MASKFEICSHVVAKHLIIVPFQCSCRGNYTGQPTTDMPLHAQPAPGTGAGQMPPTSRSHPHGHVKLFR